MRIIGTANSIVSKKNRIPHVDTFIYGGRGDWGRGKGSGRQGVATNTRKLHNIAKSVTTFGFMGFEGPIALGLPVSF